MQAVTEQQVLDALKECYDPEVPVNIVDLGLIYEVRIAPDGAKVEVDFTATSPGCHSHAQIGDQIAQKIRNLPGVTEARANLVWSPPWGPERLSESAKQTLGI